MPVPFRERFIVRRGYKPQQPRVNTPFPDSILDGLNVMAKGNGKLRMFNQVAGVGGSGAPILMLVGSTVGGVGSGSVILGPGGGLWGIGSGTGFGAGMSMGLSSILQFLRGSTLYQAGLDAPTPPTLDSPLALDTDAIHLFGNVSAKLTKKRSVTGHESNLSKVSNTVYNRASDGKYKKVRLHIPSNGEDFDEYGLYLSRVRQGKTGPHYWFDDYPKSTTLIELDYNDNQLSDILGPTDHFPPPPGTHVVQLGGVVSVLGCYGTGMSPCIPGLFESFPPLFVSFFPEGIVGVKGRATDGWLYVMCQASLNAAILTGSVSTPMLPRTIWPEVGFAHAHAATLVGSQLYANIGMPARTFGDANEPDTTFARDVTDEMKRRGFGAAAVVGYDPSNHLVIYTNGNLAFAYDTTTADEWSSPIQLGQNVVSAITHGQTLKLSNGSSLFAFDAGAAQNWYFTLGWKDGGHPKVYKIILQTYGSGENGVAVALLTNLSSVATEIQPGVSALNLTGAPEDRLDAYLRGIENFAIKVSGNGQKEFDEFIIEGLAFPKSKSGQ